MSLAGPVTPEAAGSDQVLRRVLCNSGWLLGADSIAIVLSLAHGILITRALGPSAYGALGIIIAFVTVVSRLTSFRMNEVVVKYLSEALSLHEPASAGTVVRAAVMIEATASVLAFGLVWALAPLGAEWFLSAADATDLVRLYALVVLGTIATETSTGVLQALDCFRGQSLIASAQQGLSLLGVATAVALDAGFEGILLAYVVSTFAAALFTVLLAWRKITDRLGSGWWRQPLRGVPGGWRLAARFGLSTNASSTLSLIAKEGDLLWLGYFRPAGEVGLYRLAVAIASVVTQPVNPLIHTVYPEVARHAAQSEWTAFRRLLYRTSLLSAAYIAPVVAACVLLSAPLIRYVYGEEFVAAAPALGILLLGMGFSQVFFWARPTLLALHRAGYVMRVSAVVVALKLMGLAFLAPRFGYLGVASLATAALLLGVLICIGEASAELRQRSRAQITSTVVPAV